MMSTTLLQRRYEIRTRSSDRRLNQAIKRAAEPAAAFDARVAAGMRGARSAVPDWLLSDSSTLPLLISSIVATALMPIAALWLLPLVSDLTSLVMGRLSGAKRDLGADATNPLQRILFLVPAHNESLLIGACIRSLLGMVKGHVDFEVVVVADNCEDDTVDAAFHAGARVLERVDRTKPGKPHAINWALNQVSLDDFDAITIIDADTIVDRGFADALANIGPLSGVAVQTYNGIANERDSWLTRLGGLLVKVRYDGQFLLKRFADLNCPLANGMTMGTALLRRAGWVSDSLTENWEMYARWTVLGERIRFAPNARLASQEAKSLAQSSTQRRRWQAGRWIVFQQYMGSILRSSRIRWPQKIDALAELSAPGPVLQASVAVTTATSLFFLPGTLPRVVALAFVISLVPTVAWTWYILQRQHDRRELISALARLPLYAAWRLVIAVLAVVTARRRTWQRSPRHVPEIG